MLLITDAFADRTVEIQTEQTVELRLAENPTTGYRWQLDLGPDPNCKLLSDQYTAAGAAPGGGGEHTWIIQATAPGVCALRLRYQRTWERAAPAAKTFAVSLHVSDAAR
jgi:inhibitor of cysteine peptidase